MTVSEEAVLALARSFPGWNDDTSEPDLEGPIREHMEAHWEKVNQTCIRTAREQLEALKAAGYVVEKPEWEYAVRDESPTSWYGEIYGVGTTAEKARYVADAHHDTVVRRRKAGPWEEVE